MSAISGDLIQLVDNQSFLGQQVLNVFYYRCTAPLGLADGYLSDLNDYWDTNVLSKIVPFQHKSLQHVSREWRNLSNGVDLFTDGSVVLGSIDESDTEVLPSYVSIGFLLHRESLVTRNGYKRFAGLVEGQVNGNTFIGNPTDIHPLEIALGGDLNIGVLSVAEPVIVKRPIIAPVSSYLYSSIGSASFRGLGTQNTRKAGRGV